MSITLWDTKDSNTYSLIFNVIPQVVSQTIVTPPTPLSVGSAPATAPASTTFSDGYLKVSASVDNTGGVSVAASNDVTLTSRRRLTSEPTHLIQEHHVDAFKKAIAGDKLRRL